jgi:hypothetical protein
MTPSPTADAPKSEPEPVVTETPQPPVSEKPATTEPTPGSTPQPVPEQPQPTPSPAEAQPTESSKATPEPSPEATTTTTTSPQSRPLGAEPTLADLPVRPPTSLKLTGRVMDAAGNAIANVVIVLISPRGSVLASTTDSEGNYSFSVSPSEKPFRLVPSKDGFVFDPIDKTLVMLKEDRSAINFSGKEQP